MSSSFTKQERTALLRALHRGQDGDIVTWQWNQFLAWAQSAKDDGFDDLLVLVLEGYVVPAFSVEGKLTFSSTGRRPAGKVTHAAGGVA